MKSVNNNKKLKSSAWTTRLYAVVLLALGFVFVVAGAELVALGGSSYYLVSGLLLIASGIALSRLRRIGAWLYGLFFIVTLGWAVWEVGGDSWALLPRVAAPLVVGFWLLLPAVRRSLSGPFPGQRFGGWLALAAGSVAAIAIGAGLFHLRSPQLDPIYQTGTTTAPRNSSFVNFTSPEGEWRNYGNDPGGSRFSPLTEITPQNVGELKQAWSQDIGLTEFREHGNAEGTPLIIGNNLYICKSNNEIFALDPDTGKVHWHFDPKTSFRGLTHAAACRGVAYYSVPGATGACAQRIFTNTIDARLIAVDAATGNLCPGFGVNGQTDLTTGMGDLTKGYYYPSSAPTIVRGKIVLGGWISDDQYWGEPSGVVRAYDAVTGQFAWAFDMGRPDRQTEPPSGDEYTRSTPNSWAPMSADEDLGLVYVPTGNATPDYYGGQRRPFDDQYSSAVVAVDAMTGKPRWVFQTAHHDLWDYDTPSQPTLADIQGPNGVEHVLVQATKRGELFLLDRVIGKPLAKVEERPAPQRGAAPGEHLAATQPFSTGMPSVAGPDLTEASM